MFDFFEKSWANPGLFFIGIRPQNGCNTRTQVASAKTLMFAFCLQVVLSYHRII